jgi:hypothetical protein
MVGMEISRDALLALCGMTKTTAGPSDPCCALHLRRADEYGLHLAASDGEVLCFARLVAGTDKLDKVDWADDEPIVSFRANDTATLAALAKMTKTLTINVYEAAAFVHSVGDDGAQMELKLPRVRMSNRNPFVAMGAVLGSTSKDLTPVAQLQPPLKVLHRLQEVGKKLGLTLPEKPTIARLDKVWGITFGSQAEFWACCNVETVETAAVAGLMPDWVAERAPEGERLTFVAGARQALQTVMGPEQGALPMEGDDETADSAEDAE